VERGPHLQGRKDKIDSLVGREVRKLEVTNSPSQVIKNLAVVSARDHRRAWPFPSTAKLQHGSKTHRFFALKQDHARSRAGEFAGNE
jgi:hypothetical protein